MSNYKMGKGVSYHCNSFEDIARKFGCKPFIKRTGNAEKLAKQQKNFYKRHICKACNQPLTWIEGTNIMSCTNPECKGIEKSYEDDTGVKKTGYELSYQSLSEKEEDIANNILL